MQCSLYYLISSIDIDIPVTINLFYELGVYIFVMGSVTGHSVLSRRQVFGTIILLLSIIIISSYFLVQDIAKESDEPALPVWSGSIRISTPLNRNESLNETATWKMIPLPVDDRSTVVKIIVGPLEDGEVDIILVEGPNYGHPSDDPIRSSVLRDDEVIWTLRSNEFDEDGLVLLVDNTDAGEIPQSPDYLDLPHVDWRVINYFNPLLLPSFWIMLICIMLVIILLLLQSKMFKIESTANLPTIDER